MGIHNNALIGASSQGYQISRSVRTRSSASAYFNRTLTTPTNNKIWTWSGWVKRGTLGAAQTLFSGQVDVNNWGIIAFLSGDTLSFQQADAGSVTSTVTTTQVFRDSSAWYHIIVVFDSTQATAANRLKMYVNGVQITVFGTATYLAQNTASRINTAIAHQISRYISAAQYFDGYMTEVNFIDGQALTPSSFGETNAVTGVWQPKKYAGAYGNNGYYLNFSDNSGATATTIGKDYSGNGNNWTPNNISVTAGVTYDSMVDSPTVGATSSNYATFNPIAKASSQPTFSNGNLNLAASSAWNGAVGTIGVTSGKWYWEVVNGNADSFVGICGDNLILTTADPQTLTGTIVYYGGSGSKRVDGTDTAYGASYSTETIGVALDIDGGTITFYKNNTSQGSISLSLSTLNGKTIFPFFVKYASTAIVNFGQRPFSYTPPTGFLALNTQNLPTPTISNGASYMAATLYTGNGTTQSITNTVNGISFQPDFIWAKNRTTSGSNHRAFDSVRGTSKILYPSLTNSEDTNANGLTSFNSNGFSIGNASINDSGASFVAWQWNAGGSTVTNTSGTISAQVRANATAGFSVVTFTGTAANATVGHGLGVAPSMIITKNRDSATAWWVYHTSLGNTKYIVLNTTAAEVTSSSAWNNTSPTSSVFSLGAANPSNANQDVAYCFAAVAGYSAFGKYTGNGSADGPFTYLGFRPRFIMFKRTDSTGSWFMEDSSRGTYNVMGPELYAESSAAEATATRLDFLSNGFKMRAANAGDNANGGTYIYMAFAENPFKNSLAR